MYSLKLIPNFRDHMCEFITRLSDFMFKGYKTTIFIEDIYLLIDDLFLADCG